MLIPSVISITVFGILLLNKIIYYFLFQKKEQQFYQSRSNQDIKNLSIQIQNQYQQTSKIEDEIKKENINKTEEMKESKMITEQNNQFSINQGKSIQNSVSNSLNSSYISGNEEGKSKIKCRLSDSVNNNQETQQNDKIEQQSIQKQIWHIIRNSDKNQNLELFLTGFVFMQALVSRIYIKNTFQKIEFPQIFYLSLINACVNVLFYNIFYGLLIKIFQMRQLDTFWSKLVLSLYHLGMPFFIYSELDNYIQLDFITILFAIFYGSFLQILIQRNLGFFPLLLTRIQF